MGSHYRCTCNDVRLNSWNSWSWILMDSDDSDSLMAVTNFHRGVDTSDVSNGQGLHRSRSQRQFDCRWHWPLCLCHLVTFGDISRSHFTAVCFLTNLGHHGHHQVVQLRSPVWLRQRHGLLLDQGSLRFGWAVLVAVQHLALDFHKDAPTEKLCSPRMHLSCQIILWWTKFQSWPYSRLNTTAMVFSWAAIAFYLYVL